MSMLDWAKKEVEIACKREAPDLKEGEWDYGCACYKSALKAFECLLEDGHSMMSWGFTKGILTRLMSSKPLTPIEDTSDVWNEVGREGKQKEYQCKRYHALFKTVHEDGSVTYRDLDRVSMHEKESDTYWHSGLASNIVNEMYPITMPYTPANKAYVVEALEYLTDRKNGDFDTVGLLFVTTPDGEKVEINRYFADSDDGYREISREEFDERAAAHFDRVAMEKAVR